MCKNTDVDITAQQTEDSVISSKNKKIDRQALLSMMRKYTYKFMNHTSPIMLKYLPFYIFIFLYFYTFILLYREWNFKNWCHPHSQNVFYFIKF